MSLSKSEYLDALKKKLHVELSNEERKLEEEIDKLQAALIVIKNEKRMVKAEIDFHLKAVETNKETSKSILDIPSVIWGEIGKYLQGHEFVLHNACLSSIDIEHAVTGGLTRKKMRLIGEKVVNVLVMNYYLNGRDLWQFLHTPSQDLQMFAGTSLWCLSIRERKEVDQFNGFGEEVTFKHSDDISLFQDKALKSSNKWLLFSGHDFKFDTTQISATVECELFWEAAVSFLEMFGPYLVCIRIKLRDQFPINERIQNFFTNLFRVIPKVKYFRWSSVPSQLEYFSYIFTKTKTRTVEPYYYTGGDYLQLQRMACFESLRRNCVGWEIDSGVVNIRKLRGEFWNGPKELLVFIGQEEYIMDLFHADLVNLRNIKKIIFDGDSYEWTCLALLKKFPRVTEVLLLDKTCKMGIPNDININVEEYSFPKVTKLTVNMSDEIPPPLDILPTVLPSLRHLCLIRDYDSDYLKRLKEWHRAGRFDDHNIDVYRLISENRSLKESNIWNEIGNLTVFCIEKIENIHEGRGPITRSVKPTLCVRKSEIYTKNEDGSIRFEHIFASNMNSSLVPCILKMVNLCK